MKLQEFNSGLNLRKSAHLIDVREARVLENVDVTTGSLVPIKKLGTTGIAVAANMEYYVSQAEWVSSAINRDYIEYQDILYWTEDGTYPKKYNGTTTHRLGIVGPTTIPVVTDIANHPSAITGITLTVGTTGGNLPDSAVTWSWDAGDGDAAGPPYSYRFVTVTPDGRISAAFDKTVVAGIASDTNKVTFTGVTGGPPTALDGSTLIYRLYQGTYRLVGTYVSGFEDTVFNILANDKYVENTIVAVNGTYNYLVTFYNSADGTESQPSNFSADEKVTNGHVTLGSLPVSTDPQVDQIKLYRIGGNLTAFTLVATLANGTTTYLDTLSDTDIPGTLLDSVDNKEAPTGLKYLTETYAIVMGAIDDKLYYTRTGKPNAWPGTNFIDFEAPITGIGVVANGIVVFSKFRAWVVTGTSETTFIKYPLAGDQGCIEHKTIKQLGGAILWLSTDGICTTIGNAVEVISKDALGKQYLSPVNSVVHDQEYYTQLTDGTILVLDARIGQVYKKYSMGTVRLIKALDVLYGYSGVMLYEAFAASNNESLTWHSATFLDGKYTEIKHYKDVYVRSEGSLTIKTYIEDGAETLVATTVLTTTGTHDIKLPQESQMGYSLRFEVTGTGTIKEIEYQALGRQNGR